MNRRFGLTDVVMKMIEQLSETYKIPVLNAIRTDQIIGKAARAHRMITESIRRPKHSKITTARRPRFWNYCSLPQELSRCMARPSRSNKKNPAFDPSELDD